jgi:hypothetical protein
MLLKMLGWVAAAAVASVPMLAAGTECTASVCQDPTWPAMELAAPAIALEQHETPEVIEELVASHLTTDDTIVDHETVDVTQVAVLDEILEALEEP